MNKKDWIVLVVPIVTNGFLVYFFQYFFSQLMEERARKRHNCYRLLEGLQQQLSEFYDSCRIFSNSVQAKYGNTVSESFNIELASYRKFSLFFLIHKKLLTRYSSTLALICNEMENVKREMIRIQSDLGGQITSETIAPVAEYHNHLVEILEQIIQECCADLNKIYILR